MVLAAGVAKALHIGVVGCDGEIFAFEPLILRDVVGQLTLRKADQLRARLRRRADEAERGLIIFLHMFADAHLRRRHSNHVRYLTFLS